MTTMQTYFRELVWYDDTEQGSYAACVIAPDSATADRLCALDMLNSDNNMLGEASAAEMLSDNGYADLAAYYGEHGETGSWGDIGGTACPNCTAHGGKATEFHHTLHGGTRIHIHECGGCGFTWLPLGFGEKRKELEAAALAAIADADEIDAKIKEINA